MPNELPPEDPRSVWQCQTVEHTVMSLDDIRRKARSYQGKIRFRNGLEYAAVVFITLFFSRTIWTIHHLVMQVGAGMCIAGGWYMAWQLHKRGPAREVPADLGAVTCLGFHRDELARQRDLLRDTWRWYLCPLIPGLAVLTIGAGLANPAPSALRVDVCGWVFGADGGSVRDCAALQRPLRAPAANPNRRVGLPGETVMMHRLLFLAFAAATLPPAALAQPSPDSGLPPDSEIRKLLVQRIDEYHQSVGIVAGIIEPNSRRIVAYGALDQGDARPLDGKTVFEIGSVTKVFTALALAEMARRGEVGLSDPVAKYLPADVKVPRRGDRQITLETLAEQTSGLPRMPSNFKPRDSANPYADYTADLLYQFLSSYELPRDIGSQYEYSNLGFGLLGHALSRRAGMDYEALVQARISKPLALSNTRVTLSPEMKARMAVGHNEKLERVPAWDFQALAGAGALRSTANDMLSFLAAAMGYAPSPLAGAFADLLEVRVPTGLPGMQGALGWQVSDPRRLGNRVEGWRHVRVRLVHRIRSEAARRRGIAVECVHHFRTAHRRDRYRNAPPRSAVAPERSARGAPRGVRRSEGSQRLYRALPAHAEHGPHRDGGRRACHCASHRPAENRYVRRERAGLLQQDRRHPDRVSNRRPGPRHRVDPAPERLHSARAAHLRCRPPTSPYHRTPGSP